MKHFYQEREDWETWSSDEAEDVFLHIDITASKEEIVKKMESCPICRGKLHFNYFPDFSNMCSNEIAHCNECQFRSKKVLRVLI